MELNAEIFAVGKWNGLEFTLEDLKLIAFAFSSLKDNHQVPLKMGHNGEQPFTDGQPALGWVDDVFVIGEKLMAKFVDVPELVYEAFTKKLYRNVSIELDMGVQYKGQYFTYVLSGVALLGADIPAVNTLADLQAYMKRGDLKPERAEFSSVKTHQDFSAINGNKFGVENMNEGETIKSLTTQLAAKDAEITRLVDQVTHLEQEKIEMNAKYRTIEEGEKTRKLAAQRKTLSDKLEAMVTDKKIAPHTRDEYLADYDQADNKEMIVFSVNKLEKTITGNPAYFGAEQARLRSEQLKSEENLDADKIVVTRTREYMAKHGEKNFSKAKTVVLQADPELAEKYTKMMEA